VLWRIDVVAIILPTAPDDSSSEHRRIHMAIGKSTHKLCEEFFEKLHRNFRALDHNSNIEDSFLEILREVLETRGEAGRVLLSKAIANDLSRAERTMICQFLGSELLASRLEANREPNARGLLIESVIDFINRPNLK